MILMGAFCKTRSNFHMEKTVNAQKKNLTYKFPEKLNTDTTVIEHKKELFS